ncbi:MAG TPA: protein translocase subunit SecD, partial [Gammaproteobacteria bacterium]|nr:protein translocase subunit SecD [Gammaproteobacteria bacterium]
MNQYSIWRYLLILTVLLVGVVYALPNLYGEDPAVQISGTRTGTIDNSVADTVTAVLETANIPVKAVETGEDRLLIRFNDTEAQIKAVDYIKSALGGDYVVALNLAPATPAWLDKVNALPMYLGLDLRGGVHFLLEVDMNAAVDLAIERYTGELRTILREAKIRYASIRSQGGGVRIIFRSAEDRDKAHDVI